MTARSPSAFFLSLTLHALVVGLAFMVSYAARDSSLDDVKVFELVAGEGDNYMATEAPALGTPGGAKLTVPIPPTPTPEPPKPTPQPETPPITPAPQPKQDLKPAPKPKAPETVPNFAKQIKQEVRRAETRAKREIAKERAAEEKRLAEEKRQEEKRRLSKAEFDAQNKAKTAPNSKAAPTKIAKIDAEGIAKGVVGGSPNNKVGGAGGKALVSNNDDVLVAYFSLFKQRLRERFEMPPGLSDSLEARVEVRSNADGSLVGARILRSSGSKEFDDAILDALRRMRMPARPDGKSETISFPFDAKGKYDD